MNRLQFRVWCERKKEMIYFSFSNMPTEPIEISVLIQRNEIEIMQGTGLKDKNEVEIFEGDIVQSIDFGQKERARAIVIFEGHKWITVPKNRGKNNIAYQMFSDIVGEEGKCVEIIGNKYSNPKLLNV